jgi:hypothetical protein
MFDGRREDKTKSFLEENKTIKNVWRRKYM